MANAASIKAAGLQQSSLQYHPCGLTMQVMSVLRVQWTAQFWRLFALSILLLFHAKAAVLYSHLPLLAERSSNFGISVVTVD